MVTGCELFPGARLQVVSCIISRFLFLILDLSGCTLAIPVHQSGGIVSLASNTHNLILTTVSVENHA